MRDWSQMKEYGATKTFHRKTRKKEMELSGVQRLALDVPAFAFHDLGLLYK